MEAAYAEGRVVQSAPGNVPRFKRYLDEQPGRKRDNLWSDVGFVESSEVEWATRKPAALYRRLIECATDPGDMVCDPFAGCATTCVAAEQLQREWIGIDIDPVAERVTLDRLAHETGLSAMEMPVTVRRSLRRSDYPLHPRCEAPTGVVGATGAPMRQPVL